jgi:hypothetical protein
MSQEKTIKISPELFSLKSKKNKTLKNKGKELRPNIQVNNKIKNKLIEKVKQYQQKNKEDLLIKNNLDNNNNNNSENNLLKYNEFEDSINFLKILSDKNEKRKDKRQNKTLKNLDNVYVHTNIPSEFEINLKTNDKNLEKMDSNSGDKPYGCLKNGSKPTYKQWFKNTQKNKIHTELDERNKISNVQSQIIQPEPLQLQPIQQQLAQPKPVQSPILKQEVIKEQVIEEPIIKEKAIPPLTLKSPPSMLEKNTQLLNIKPDFDYTNKNENPNKYLINKMDNQIDSNIDITEKPYPSNNIDTNNLHNNNIDTNNSNGEDIYEIKLHRNTKTLKYKLGKKNNKIGVLVKNNQTLKKIKNDFAGLKKVSMAEIKKYLRSHNLIKIGCIAPNDVLRKMYESALLSGDINNTNNENLLHNFINDETNI